MAASSSAKHQLLATEWGMPSLKLTYSRHAKRWTTCFVRGVPLTPNGLRYMPLHLTTTVLLVPRHKADLPDR